VSLDATETVRRLTHVREVLFGEFTMLVLVVGVCSWAILRVCSSGRQREWWLVAASVGTVAWFSGPWLTALWLVWAIAFRAVGAVGGTAGAVASFAMLASAVVLPVVFVGETGKPGPYAREFTAFATNVALLRFWAWAWDRRRAEPRGGSLRTYLVRMFFFPTVVNGPVETGRDFAAEWPRPDVDDLGAGLARVAGGVAKLVAVGLALGPGWNAGLAGAMDGPGWRLWGWGALLYAWFYLSFSAWSDVAIGVGRLCGRRVRENFDAPWLAADVGDFWRRWHVSLGAWLRDYVYVPLGGNRRWRVRNVLVTFLVSALWHVWGTLKMFGIVYYPPAAWGGFLVWGALHAVGVLAMGRLAPEATLGRAGRIGRRVATFAFAAWAWIPFFLPASVGIGAGLAAMGRMLLPR